MPAKLKLTGFDELKTQFDNIQEVLTPLAEEMLLDVMDQIITVVSVYPPQPARDRAKTFNRYVRGVGLYPRSAFNEAGELISLVSGLDRVIFSSEQLSLRWEKHITSTIRGTVGVVRNTASYADFVVGEMQTAFHEETGWPTIRSTVEELDPVISEQVELLLDSIEEIALRGVH